MGDNGNGKYLLFGPGAHRIQSAFYHIADDDVSIMNPFINHGTWTILTVRSYSIFNQLEGEWPYRPALTRVVKSSGLGGQV